jgi:hypothetical protein
MCRLLILCLVLFTTGCAGNLSFVKTSYDQFKGDTTVRMSYNDLGGSNMSLGTCAICLNIQKVISKEGCESYSLIAEYVKWVSYPKWLFIKSGESLVLLIDGKRIGLTGEGSENHREVVGGNIIETAWYPVSAELIRTISNAKEVKVKLIGSNSFVERYFVQRNFNNFKKFVESYLP